MSTDAQETVVLVHGLGRSRLSLRTLARRLREAGFATVNVPYAPTFHRFETLVEDFHDYLVKEVKTERYHLVGHSLGNILIRARFAHGYPTELGRIVMLAPPNHPPRLARKLHSFPPFRLWAGDSGQQLASQAFYDTLPTPTVPFGVIAGSKGQLLTFGEPNDGIVTVESTRLAGMKEHLILPHTHTFMMNSPAVAEATISFLQHGNFGATPAKDE